MTNLASLSTARVEITGCDRPRDAIVLRDHDGHEIAHAKPTDANQAVLTELAATFNALRLLHVSLLQHASTNEDGSITFDHMRQMPAELRTGLAQALNVLRAVHLLGNDIGAQLTAGG